MILGHSELIIRFSYHLPDIELPHDFFVFIFTLGKERFGGSFNFCLQGITHLKTHYLCRSASIDTTLICGQIVVALMIYKGNHGEGKYKQVIM